MNEIKVSVSFKTGKCIVYGYNPIDNDYNASKMVFNFDDDYEGRKVIEIRPAYEETKDATFVSEIINNEVILSKLVDGQYYSVFTKPGNHIVEVHLYNDNSKLTAICNKYFKVEEEQVNIGDEQATVYLPIFDQIIQELDKAIDETNNLNLDISKTDNKTTIELTKKDGTTKTVEVLDGNGIASIITQESQVDEGNNVITITDTNGQVTTFIVKNGSKGNTGAPGQIKMLIVNELPLTGSGDTLYFVSKSNPEQEDLYDEYVWLNNHWEPIGEKQITIDLSDYYTKQETNTLLDNKADTSDIPDLTDYVRNTNYATGSVAGIIKIGNGSKMSSNNAIYADTYDYATYQSLTNSIFIGKGTLENVITGKELVNKTYVDNLVGDINTALDTINNEVI